MSEHTDLAGWIEPLDDDLRRDWCEANIDVYTGSFQIVDKNTTVSLQHAARNRLRYEATLQAKDAQIAALERVISQRCVDDQACIFADELLTAIKEVTK